MSDDSQVSAQAFDRDRTDKSTEVGTVVAYRGTNNITMGDLRKKTPSKRKREDSSFRKNTDGFPVVLLFSNTLWSLNSQSAYAFVLIVSVFHYKTFHLCRQMPLKILTKSFLRNCNKFTCNHS